MTKYVNLAMEGEGYYNNEKDVANMLILMHDFEVNDEAHASCLLFSS